MSPRAARSAERAGGAGRDVLSQDHYRQAAERLRAEIAELPGHEHGVELLERLAAEKRPLLAE